MFNRSIPVSSTWSVSPRIFLSSGGARLPAPTGSPVLTAGTKRQTVRRDLRRRSDLPPTLPALKPQSRCSCNYWTGHTSDITVPRGVRWMNREAVGKQKIRSRLTPFSVHLEPPLSMQQHGGSAWLTGGERGERDTEEERERERHAQLGLSVHVLLISC